MGAREVKNTTRKPTESTGSMEAELQPEGMNGTDLGPLQSPRGTPKWEKWEQGLSMTTSPAFILSRRGCA